MPALPHGITLARPSAKRCLRRRGQGTRQSHRDRPDSVGRAPPAPRNGGWRKSRGQCPPYRTESPLLDHQQGGIHAKAVKVRGNRSWSLRLRRAGTARAVEWRLAEDPRAMPALPHGITLARPSAKRCLRRRGQGTRQSRRDRSDSVGRAPPAPWNGGWRKSRGQCPPYRTESPLLDHQQGGIHAKAVKVRGNRIVIAPTP